MPLSNLPHLATEAFADISDEVEESRNSMLAIQRRIHDVENQVRNLNRSEQSEEIAKYDAELIRQLARLSAAQAEHTQLARVHTALKMWIDQLPVSARYEDCETKYRLEVGENYEQACRTLRFEIEDSNSDLNGAIHSVRTLPERYAEADAIVASLAAQAEPKIITRDNKTDIKFPTDKTLPMMAWLSPEALKAKLYETIDTQHKRDTANGHLVMDDAKAKAQIKEMRDEMLALERKEEALIREASVHGTTIPRRESASPLAILAIRPATIKQKAKAA